MADKITDFLGGTVYGGVFCILIGVLCLYYVYISKTPQSKESPFFPKWKGILGGILSIIIGIVIIIDNI